MAVVPAVPAIGAGLSSPSQLAQLCDVVSFLRAVPLANLRQTVAQSLTTGTMTAISFDVEDADTNVAGTSQHDNVTNNSRFTAVYAGWYDLGGGIGFAAGATNRRACRWAVNGAVPNGTAVYLPTTGAGTCEIPARGHRVFLNVGDYVELQGYQDTGGALNTAVTTDTMATMVVGWRSV